MYWTISERFKGAKWRPDLLKTEDNFTPKFEDDITNKMKTTWPKNEDKNEYDFFKKWRWFFKKKMKTTSPKNED